MGRVVALGVPGPGVSVAVKVTVGVSVTVVVSVTVGVTLGVPGPSVAVIVGVVVGVVVGVAVTVGVSVTVAVAVAVGTAAGQVGPVMVSLISVTSPPIARARPSRFTPLPKWTPVPAMIVPANELPLIVARLATCQYKSQGLAPLVKLIEPEETKELDALKI